MKPHFTALCTLALMTAFASPALAQRAGQWSLGVGVSTVMPKSDNGTLSGGLKPDVGNSTRPSFTAEYFFRDNWGIELLAALPFKHSVSIDGLGEVGHTDQLHPVLSVQYHFPTSGRVQPFVGAGVNYTMFFKEKTSGALAGSSLNLKNSFGLALHAGLDYKISPHGALRADVRWIDIRSKAELNGKDIG
ncbi:OmpW family protein, partial [Thioclava sp. BHET1]